MNFICPKCGCSYESDTAKCPYCGFAIQKCEPPAQPMPEKKKEFGEGLASAVVAFVIAGAFVLLVSLGIGLGEDEVLPFVHLLLILLFPFYPLWLI